MLPNGNKVEKSDFGVSWSQIWAKFMDNAKVASISSKTHPHIFIPCALNDFNTSTERAQLQSADHQRDRPRPKINKNRYSYDRKMIRPSFFKSVLRKYSKSCSADHQRDRPRASNINNYRYSHIEKWFDHHFSLFLSAFYANNQQLAQLIIEETVKEFL